MTATEVPGMRCAYSDLRTEECGHCLGTPDLPRGSGAGTGAGSTGGSGSARDTGPLPLAIEGTWATAQWPGECGCGCGQQIEVGDDICKAAAPGPTVSSPVGLDWCLVTCTRMWEVAP